MQSSINKLLKKLLCYIRQDDKMYIFKFLYNIYLQNVYSIFIYIYIMYLSTPHQHILYKLNN